MIRRRLRTSGGALLGWILALLAVLGALAVYFLLYPEELPAWAARTGMGRDMQTTTVYKWRDAAGEWHVSDQPPPAGTDYELQDYARDTNVLPLPPELQR